MIHDLVRSGRATPHDGAMLIELQRDLRARKERKQQRPTSRLWAAIGIAFALLGVKHS